MKITGKVIFEKTPGRKDPWVKKQVESDYFIALQIIEIDGQPVITTQDMYNFIKSKLPKVVINNEVVNDLFTNPTLPPNAKDVPHITLGNFPDFRFKRSVEQDIEREKIDSAIEVEGQQFTFELTDQDFELVIASKNPAVVEQIRENDLVQFRDVNASVVTTPNVGMNRDAIFNLKPGIEAQRVLGELSKKIFGKDFELWNAQNKPVPYHLTVAQASQLTQKLESASKLIADINDSEVRKLQVFSK
jgi:hypothetical protein